MHFPTPSSPEKTTLNLKWGDFLSSHINPEILLSPGVEIGFEKFILTGELGA